MNSDNRPWILINGISARYGGGRVILDGLLHSLSGLRCGRYRYAVVTAYEASAYEWARCEHIRILDVPAWMKSAKFQAFFYLVYLHRIIARNHIAAILNLADITVRVRIPLIYFFDWSYLVYPHSVVWNRMGIADFLFRRIKARLILSQIRCADLILTQTNLMGARLRCMLVNAKTQTIPTPVRKQSSDANRDFGLPFGRFKLICLSNYAPHKNLELLIGVARELRRRRATDLIVTTLDPNTPPVRRLLLAIETEGLSEWLSNIGQIENRSVPGLLAQSDALLLPTLLESYGLPYFEAMAAKLPIITSNLDFAKAACGEAAFYFNPFNAVSAANAIQEASANPAECARKAALGAEILAGIPEWDEFQARLECIFDTLHLCPLLHGTTDE